MCETKLANYLLIGMFLLTVLAFAVAIGYSNVVNTPAPAPATVSAFCA